MNRVVGLAFQAWLLGLATLGLVVLPGVVVLGGLWSEPFLQTLPERLLGWVVMIPSSLLMTLMVVVLVSLPLFVIGLLVALAFERRIARQPLVFAGLAPLVAAALWLAVTLPQRRGTVWGRIHWELLHPGPWIFALPVLVGSLWFCTRLARRSAGAAAVPEARG